MLSPLAVSVIVAVHDGETYLAAALRSAAEQSVPPLEIIVVDDGSNDSSALVASGFGPPVRCVRQDNAGPASARRRGLREARGELVAFLDADDVWPRERNSMLLQALRSRPELGVAIGRLVLVRDGRDGEPDLVALSAPLSAPNLGGTLIRREVFERVELDPSMRFGEDVDWFLRAGEAGVGMASLDEVTLFYRRHAGSMTADRGATHAGLLNVLRKSLARRRAGVSVSTPAGPWSDESEAEFLLQIEQVRRGRVWLPGRDGSGD